MDMASPVPVKAKKKKRKVFDHDECSRLHLAVLKGYHQIPKVTTLATFDGYYFRNSIPWFSLPFFEGEGGGGCRVTFWDLLEVTMF